MVRVVFQVLLGGDPRNMSRPVPKPIRLIGEDLSNVCSFLFLDTMLLTGTQAGAIKELNLQTFRPSSVLQESAESPVSSLRSCEQSVLSREKNGPVRCWQNHESGWVSSLLTDQSYGFSNIEVDEANNVAFIPGENATVQMYSMKTHSKVAEFKHNIQIMCLKFIYLSDGPYLISAHENGDVCLWDVKTTKIVNTLNVDNCVTAVDFSSESRRGICGTVSQDVHVFSIDNSHTLAANKTFQVLNEGVECACVRPDNKIVALGCWDGTVRVFTWKSLRPLAVLDQFDTSVQDLAFVNHKLLSKDGSYLMAACGDKYVAFWDLYN